MQRYAWKDLNRQQVGAYAEYFVKMELTMYGFQVYSTDVDDRGIDFITRYQKRSFLEVQVKALRCGTDDCLSSGYVFLEKTKFALSDDRVLALVLLLEGKVPELYLIPSTVWLKPDKIFVSRDYGPGRASTPEWGLNVSKKNLPALEPYRFEKTLAMLRGEAQATGGAS